MTIAAPPKVFNVSFKDFKLIELNFALNRDYDKWEGAAKGWQGIVFEHGIVIETGYDYKDKALRLQMTVRATAKDAPFNVSVSGIGLFAFEEAPDMEQLERFARINCAAIVYPYIREAIADVTRRSGMPTLHLQPVNFVKMFAELKDKSVESEKKAATS